MLAATATMSFCLDWSALVIGPLLGLIAWNSFRGAKRLRNFDLTAPALLAMNQMYLAGLIIVYALYSLHQGLSGHSSLDDQLAAFGGGRRGRSGGGRDGYEEPGAAALLADLRWG